MPLSEHEQRILEEIEQRLAEDDPRLAEHVSRTDLFTHLARRLRIASLAFGFGVLLLLAFAVSPWIGAAGFVVMVLSALVLYRSLGQLGREQLRAMQRSNVSTLGGWLARLASRMRRPPSPPAGGDA